MLYTYEVLESQVWELTTLKCPSDSAKPTHLFGQQSAKESREWGRGERNLTPQNAYSENQHVRKLPCAGGKKLIKPRTFYSYSPKKIKEKGNTCLLLGVFRLKIKYTSSPF